SRRRFRIGGPPDRPAAKVPERAQGVALAVGLSGEQPLAPRGERIRATTSSARDRGAEGGARRRAGRESGQARHLPHPAPLLRHSFTRARPGHPHRAGAPRPPRRQDDDDLHARPAPRRKRCKKPAGRHLMLRTRLTLRPGRPGTKDLVAEFGDRLLCVRYRYDDEHHLRYKTAEVIIEAAPWTPARPFAATDVIELRIRPQERTLRHAARLL